MSILFSFVKNSENHINMSILFLLARHACNHKKNEYIIFLKSFMPLKN